MVTIIAHVAVSTNEFPRYDSSLQLFNYLNKTRFIIIHELLIAPNHIQDQQLTQFCIHMHAPMPVCSRLPMPAHYLFISVCNKGSMKH